MAEKRTRRSSEEVWQDKIKAQEAKVASLKASLEKEVAELETLKNTPPKRSTRAENPTLIAKLSHHPEKLKEIFEEAKDDGDKFRELLIKAVSELEK